MSDRICPSLARLCEDCGNLVTTDPTCPLCDGATRPSEHASELEHYCGGCGEGKFPRHKLHLVTWNEDPYSQMEDGDLNTICLKCKKEQEEEL